MTFKSLKFYKNLYKQQKDKYQHTHVVRKKHNTSLYWRVSLSSPVSDALLVYLPYHVSGQKKY